MKQVTPVSDRALDRALLILGYLCAVGMALSLLGLAWLVISAPLPSAVAGALVSK